GSEGAEGSGAGALGGGASVSAGPPSSEVIWPTVSSLPSVTYPSPPAEPPSDALCRPGAATGSEMPHVADVDGQAPTSFEVDDQPSVRVDRPGRAMHRSRPPGLCRVEPIHT